MIMSRFFSARDHAMRNKKMRAFDKTLSFFKEVRQKLTHGTKKRRGTEMRKYIFVLVVS